MAIPYGVVAAVLARSPTPTPAPTLTPTPSPSTSPGQGADACQLFPDLTFCKNPDLNPGHAIAGSVIDKVASAFADAATKSLQAMMTWWADLDTPTIAIQDRTGEWHTSGPVLWLQGHTHWLVILVATFGLLLAAGRMAWSRRGEPAAQALSGLFTLAVVTGCSAAAVTLATQGGDAYSKWILAEALGKKTMGGWLTKAVALNAAATPGLVIIVAVIATISCLVQIAMLLVRVAMLGLLTGALPLGAAATTTPDGRAWFKKMLSWLIAFVLYKPVAATIYAFGFVAMKVRGDLSQLAGITTIVLAVLTLPALMRFVTPMVAAASVGGGGGMAVGGAVGAMGARMVPGVGGDGGGTSGGGGAPSSGDRTPKGASTPSSPGGDKPPGQDQPSPPPKPSGGQQPQGAPPVTGEPISTAALMAKAAADKTKNKIDDVAEGSGGKPDGNG